MAIYKSLGPDDISRIPFNANRLFRFSSASGVNVGVVIDTFENSTSALDTFSSTSNDSKNTIKYYQLDHLFYKNYLRDISNRLGDADYLAQNRTLYTKANVISIPSTLYGNKIKPNTFSFSGSFGHVLDDGKGNLIISGTHFVSHSLDERQKVFNLGPVKGFKQYDVNYDLYGNTTPNPLTYYNKKNVYDDSYYSNVIEYKNITFSEENYNKTNTTGSKINFLSNGTITSSIVAPHNETYNFKTSKLVSDGNSVFFSNNKNQFYSIDLKTGTTNWINEVNSNVKPILVGNLIFTISNEGYLYLIDKNKGNIVRITDLFLNYKDKKRKNIYPIGFVIGDKNVFLTNSNGKMIIAGIEDGKIIKIEKVSGGLVSEPFIFNNNLYVVRNGSIVQYN